MKFKYKEYDLPNKKLQEELSKLTLEELEEIIKREEESLRKQWALEDAKEQADKNESK